MPSHYLNQCWNVLNSNPRNKFQWNRNRNSYIFIQGKAFENIICEMAAILLRPLCVNSNVAFINKLISSAQKLGSSYLPFLEREGWRMLWTELQDLNVYASFTLHPEKKFEQIFMQTEKNSTRKRINKYFCAYHQTSNISRTLVENKIVDYSDRLSALLQVHQHSRLNTCLQYIAQRQL